MAILTGKARNKLGSADQFAYVDSEGKGHLPLNDASHVRNALARFNETAFEKSSDKRAASAKIRSAAEKLDVKVADSDLKMAAGHAAVVRMIVPASGDFAEGDPFVAVRTGDWTWKDYGRVQITRDDLALIKASFDEDARRQDLPILNEDHDKSRAIGWVRELVYDGEDALRIVPDYNPVGKEIVQNDQYRYCSPELLFDYQDAETGAIHPAVLSGVALTNFPRMKSLGGIAASEGVLAGVMAFSEGPAVGTTAQDAVDALMSGVPEDALLSEDDSDPLPPCSLAPPFSSVGRCPAYTKVLDDGDGDRPGDLLGCCALSALCNGYQPTAALPLPMATDSPTVMYSYSEGNRMPEPQPTDTAPIADTAVGTEPAGATAVAVADPDEAAVKLEMAEKRSSDLEAANVALKAELDAAKATNTDLSAKVTDIERRFGESEATRAAERQAMKLAQTKSRIDALVAANKITPAEGQAFSEDTNLLVFSESPSILETLEARAVPAVPMKELGTEGGDGPTDEREKLASLVRDFAEREAKEGRKADPAAAAAFAVATMKGSR